MRILTAITFMFLFTQEADACSYCVMSMVNLVFPFMWKALWILVPWRILYLYFQSTEIKARPFAFFGKRLLGLAFLYLSFNLAGFFVYLMGSFIKALWKSIRSLIKPVPGQPIRILWGLQAAALVLLVPLVVVTYIRYSRLDDLDRLRECVYPGSSQSIALARKIAQDPYLDIEHLREMLLSKKFGDIEKASEVLRFRKSSDDVFALQDTILNWEYDSDICNWSEITGLYFHFWLDGVTGKEIKTKEELRTWITAEEARRKAASAVASEVTGASATHPTQ